MNIKFYPKWHIFLIKVKFGYLSLPKHMAAVLV